MPTSSSLLWVNKTPDSKSLSNCKNEQQTSRQIRSHAVTAGHKSSRIKKPIKRTPRRLEWSRESQSNSRSRTSHSRNDNNNPLPKSSQRNFKRAPIAFHPLTTNLHPSCHPIPLTPQTLKTLHYFTSTWVSTAFKLPGCIGFSQPPLPSSTITSLVQSILQDATSTYCLLAASFARRAYLTPHSSQNQAHVYAAKAMSGLRQRLHFVKGKGRAWDEDDVTSILFLAAYEVFCEDERAAERHLVAVRRFYRGQIRNEWVERLRGNLEILVVRSLGS